MENDTAYILTLQRNEKSHVEMAQTQQKKVPKRHSVSRWLTAAGTKEKWDSNEQCLAFIIRVTTA